MTRSLTAKLILAFVLVALITGLVLAGVFRTLNANRFDDFVLDQQTEALVSQLVEFYKVEGSWDNLRDSLFVTTMGMGQGMGQGMGMGGQNQGGPSGQGWQGGMQRDPQGAAESRRLFGLADENGNIVIPVGNYADIGEPVTAADLRTGAPVTVDGKRVGTVLRVQRLPVYSAAEQLFLEKTNRALLFALIGAAIVAILVGIYIARTLTRPLNQLTVAAHQIGKGQHEQVKVTSNDEIGDLGRAFNQMTAEIEHGTRLRKQMTADIAHDLRTPLTVIGGYVEALQDKVLEPTPECLALIHAEIDRLKRMVDDLRTLSMADAGELPLQRQLISPADLVRQVGELFAPLAAQKGVQVITDAGTALPSINVDETRMMQILENLLANALRYTPSGGSIRLGAVHQGSTVRLTVSDTGSGIPADELGLIFERFHKGDKARTNDSGSGLGLAIVKAMIEAHSGSVDVQSTPGSGTTFTLTLPAQI